MYVEQVASSNADTPRFEEHLKQSLQSIRGSLTDLLATVGLDGTRPQVVADRFGLNKNLTWKLSKIIGSTHDLAVVQHLPGRPGVRILLTAFAEAGVPEEAIDQVRAAMRQFEGMVAVHCGDRATFELMVSSLDEAHADMQEASRKLAYQGNSAIWGMQARVRLSTNFVAPSANADDRLDLVGVGGMLDVRRFRPAASWPLFRSGMFNDDGTPLVNGMEPLDPSVAPGEIPLLADFCSPLPEIRKRRVPDGVQYELKAGPVGNTAAISYVIGYMTPAVVSQYRDESNIYGGHPAPLVVPTETFVSDLFVHEALGFEMPPVVDLHSRLISAAAIDGAPLSDDRSVFPLLEEVFELGSGLTVAATPLIPRYTKLLRTVFDRLGWDPSSFRVFRFLQRYPPIPSLAVMRYPLLERP